MIHCILMWTKAHSEAIIGLLKYSGWATEMFDEKRESLHAEGFPFLCLSVGGCLHIEGDDIEGAHCAPLQIN